MTTMLVMLAQIAVFWTVGWLFYTTSPLCRKTLGNPFGFILTMVAYVFGVMFVTAVLLTQGPIATSIGFCVCAFLGSITWFAGQDMALGKPPTDGD